MTSQRLKLSRRAYVLWIAAPVFFACLQTLSHGSGLFQYGVWRSDDRIVSAPFVDGVVVYFHWNILERQPGQIDLEPILRVRTRVREEGQRFILRVVTADHTPAWLYRQGVPRVAEKIDGQLRAVPLYWHPLYLQRLDSLVRAIGERLDGDNSLEAIQIGIATYGEMLLGGRDWISQGFSSSIWTDACRSIIDIYKGHFKKTPLMVMIMSQEFPGGRQTESMKAVAEYAATHGVGLQFNGLSPDNSYLWGLLSEPDPDSAIGIFRRFRPEVPLSFEFTSDKVDPRLSCMNALSEQASYLCIHSAFLEDVSLAPLFTFAHRFLGRTPQDSDAVWTLLRQTYPSESMRTGKKNYDFGLEQVEPRAKEVVCSNGSAFNVRGKTSALNSFKGLPCRKTNSEEDSGHMVFKVSAEFDPGPDPTLSVVYADIGEDTWRPMYITNSGLRVGRIISKHNTGKWLRADFTLDGFSKGSPIDLLIDSNNDGDEYVHFVQLTRTGNTSILPFSFDQVPCGP